MKKNIFQYKKRIDFLYQERLRIEKLKIPEQKYLLSGFTHIAGLDEVGRGSLAGPVVAAAVIIKDLELFFISGLKDSKKIPEEKRTLLSHLIIEKAYDIGIGSVDSDIIDEINILQATLLAMKRAIGSLKKQPDYLLVDALTIPDVDIAQDSIVRGEYKSISIAAASIIAKVYRDRLMREYHKTYPAYGFDRHKGYGTQLHLEMIRKKGICPLHRKTFKGVQLDNIQK